MSEEDRIVNEILEKNGRIKLARKVYELENIIKEIREEVRILESNCDISKYHAQKLYQTLDKEGVN